MATKKQEFHRYLVWTFWVSILFTIGFTYYYMDGSTSGRLNVVLEEEETLNFPILLRATILSENGEVVLGSGSNIPPGETHTVKSQPFTVCGKQEGSYRIGLKLFGWFQLKEVQVDMVDTRYTIPCGAPIGIYSELDGVIMTGTGQVTDTISMIVEPATNYLQPGGYIEAISGQALQDKERLAEVVRKLDKSMVSLEVHRGEKLMEVAMNPVESEEGDYKLGVWVRSDTQGIGTMTYLDLNGNLGALGHGISDSDTGEVVQISGGSLYETEIMGIERGSIGKPGVMPGIIYYGPSSGLKNISKNTEEGIFGAMNNKFAKRINSKPLEIGYQQDVRKGPAVLRSGVSGEVRGYEIEIQKADCSTSHKNKNLVVKVVDEELLQLTNGITRGVSGGPIIQDGGLVSAVTHVFIQGSTKGYGIFIENMLDAGGQQT